MGILVDKGLQVRQQDVFAQSVADADAQVADVEFLDPAQLLFAALQGFKCFSGMLEQDFPFAGQLYPAGAAGKQGESQAVLQLADGLADGGLAYVCLLYTSDAADEL